MRGDAAARILALFVAGAAAACSGGSDSIDAVPHIDAPPPIDGRTDATPGTYRIEGTAAGIRGPVPLRLTAGTEQTVQVTVDGAFEFPTTVPDGTPFTVTMDGAPPCVLDGGAGTIAGADVELGLTCDGVVELASVGFSMPTVLTPPFDPIQTAYDGARPPLLDPPDTFTVTPVAAYPAIATLTVNGTAVASGQASSSLTETAGVDVTIVVADPAHPTLTRTYTVALAAGALVPDGYIKASTAEAGDTFGAAVAASVDTIAIGAPTEDSNATGVGGDQTNNGALDSGAVYVLRRSGSTWTQEAYLKASNTGSNDRFGTSVGLSGDLLVVGAPNEDSSSTGIDSVPNEAAADAGAAYVYRRTGSTWAFEAYLKPPNTGAGDHFGWSVAADADVVVVGAYNEDSSTNGVNTTPDEGASNAGAAYVFRHGPGWTQEAYLKASTSETNDAFGWSVAVTTDLIAVGAPLEDSPATGIGGGQGNGAPDAGAVYVFAHAAGWTQDAYIKASNTAADTAVGDWFGWSVGLSGDTLIAGAPNEDGAATDGGAAYVYRRVATWSFVDYLHPAVPDASDEFGFAVAVDGDYAVVGSHREDSVATGVGGDQNDDSVGDTGAAYVFHRAGAAWTQAFYAKSVQNSIFDHFGWAVAAGGDIVVVGAYAEDGSASGVDPSVDEAAMDAGAVYAFR